MNVTPVKRALLSVSNKQGLIEFAKNLVNLGVEVISTGGTSQLLQAAKVPHQTIEAITGMPEMLNGRVKTLHPKIHGGILGRRDAHALEADRHGIQWIDLVVVNFYPFQEATQNASLTKVEAVEYVDIGGPAMVRAAAKNFAWVGVVTDPSDYTQVIQELASQQGLSTGTRQQLAAKAFALTSRYDAMIGVYFAGQPANKNELSKLQYLEESITLRYGENPHQQAHAYVFPHEKTSVLQARQHQGKPLSYNNILDADAALHCVQTFTEPTCVIVKHANPCGVASAATIDTAYTQAYQADVLSAFGGIIALNRPCTEKIAKEIAVVFVEVVIAPAYTPEALAVLAAKPNLRVLEIPEYHPPAWEMRFIAGGLLLQERDLHQVQKQELNVVTKKRPSEKDWQALLFAWRIAKHIKSNGIVVAKDTTTIGIGAGLVSRIDAVDLAIRKGGSKCMGAALASDAFFPFRDSIDAIAESGINAIIQPGGSLRDEEVIAACDERLIAMVFTGKRCFKH